MQIIGSQPASNELVSNVENLTGDKGNAFLNLITAVRAEAQDEGPPRVVVDVGPLMPANYKMTANRIAKALTRELTKASWSTSALVASIDIEPEGSERTVPLGRPSLGIDVAQLDDFLTESLASLNFSPHTITLFEVGLGQERWAFLSLIYSRGPRCAEQACRHLRDELKNRFGVLLRLVAAPERGNASAALFDRSQESVLSGGLPEVSDPGVSTHRGFRVGRRLGLPLPAGVGDWRRYPFTSIDGSITRLIEDMMSAAPACSPDCEVEGLMDLRVGTPLRLPEFEALSPGVTLPVIGVRALLAPGVGPVQEGEVVLVEARNGRACDVGRASQIMFELPDAEELRRAGIELNSDERALHTQLQSIRDAALILHDRDVTIGAALPTHLASSEGDESGRLRFTRAERVVSSVIRFMQEQILGWRDRLDVPPTLLVSRPTFPDEDEVKRILDLASYHVERCGYPSVSSATLEPASILYPSGRLMIAEALVAGGYTDEARSIPRLLHDAYYNRKLHLLGPQENSRPGDALHLKRGKYGFINNLQVASKLLGLPILEPELLRQALNASARRKNLDRVNATRLGDAIREQQEQLLERLW
jgi:hypothetical protein